MCTVGQELSKVEVKHPAFDPLFSGEKDFILLFSLFFLWNNIKEITYLKKKKFLCKIVMLE